MSRSISVGSLSLGIKVNEFESEVSDIDVALASREPSPKRIGKNKRGGGAKISRRR